MNGARASLATLTVVELRKLVDTRAGIAICVVSALLAGAFGAGALAYRHPATIGGIALMAGVPGGTLLPVLAILLVTAERTHRTALATYALTPQRHRVLLAKAAGTVALALAITPLSFLAALVIGPVGSAVSGHRMTWTVAAGPVARTALIDVLMALTGYALALATANAPTSIVIVLVWPVLQSTLQTASPAMGRVVSWLDVLAVTESPARAATALAFWLALPILIGFRRTLRADVR
jgi:ABC-2 type transport system permease protein